MPLALDLEKQSNVLVELSKAEEADKLVHDWFLKVGLNTEGALDESRIENLHLLLSIKGVLIHLHSEGVLISIIIEIDESVIEQEARIALLAVRVIYLLTTFNVF